MTQSGHCGAKYPERTYDFFDILNAQVGLRSNSILQSQHQIVCSRAAQKEPSHAFTNCRHRGFREEACRFARGEAPSRRSCTDRRFKHGQHAVYIPRVKAIVDALKEFDITIHLFSLWQGARAASEAISKRSENRCDQTRRLNSRGGRGKPSQRAEGRLKPRGGSCSGA